MKPNSLCLFIATLLYSFLVKAQDSEHAVKKEKLYVRAFAGVGVNSYMVNPGTLSFDFPTTVYNSQNNTTYPLTLNPSASFSSRRYAWEIPFGLEFIYRKYTANISFGIGFGKYGPFDFSLGLGRTISISKNFSINAGLDYFQLQENLSLGAFPQSGLDITINGTTYYHQYHAYNSGHSYNATYLNFNYYQAIGGIRPKASLIVALSKKIVIKLNVVYNFSLYNVKRLQIMQEGNTAHPQNLYPNVVSISSNSTSNPYFNYSFTGSSHGPFYAKGLVANIEIGYNLKRVKRKKKLSI